jgi:TfoX/Sxy family transcriptional regulator of competence genes
MAYDEHLAERIGRVLRQNHISFEEKKMMGGLCFMVDDKMCVGITKGKLMARIHPDLYVQVLEKEGCQEMNFTGRPMKGFVFVEPEVIDLDGDLEYWVQLCLDFNPLARRSKKR